MTNKNEFTRLLALVRSKKPLVHHITNYVTVNDCANITLAIGASPIMADAAEEAGDIAAIASSVVLNIGTLNNRTVESMMIAGESANQIGVPVVFDPVGAGASKMRNETVERILDGVKVAVVRGNLSEIRYIAGLSANTKGVDASEQDGGDAGEIARNLAQRLGCVIAITGAVDTVSDGGRTIHIHNGHSALSGVTGTGCMCSSLIGAFCGAIPNQAFEGTVAALLCMGIAGELAYEKSGQAGYGSFHMGILDAISKLDANTLHERMKYDEA